VLKPSSEWEISKRPDLAIIDNDLWGRVQKRIETRKTGPHKKKRSSEPKYLFSGLMKCHVCGSNYALISGSDRPNPRFGCSRNWCRGAAACSNYFKVSQDEIESVILSDIQNDLLSPPILSAIINKANKYLKAKLDKLKRESGDIVKRRLQLQKNLSNILDAIGQAGMTPGLHRRLTDIESQIRELDTNQETLNRAYDFENLKIDEEYVSSWLGRLKDLLNTDLTSARAELGSLIGEFTLSPEMIEGVKYLRVKANANIGGLLRIATGRHSNKKLNTQPPVFKQLKSAIILNPALLGSGFI
ncbi:MAG: recombinase zinc beta ribbon domain-containing protein, partial [candidate division Zixibacteria bacterium]|nr:recombinase zinc beta ribbon domain-containing protein [candidate division Zixibacteria bacterium]